MEEKSNEGLLFKVDHLARAAQVLRRIAAVEVRDGELLLEVNPACAGAIGLVLAERRITVKQVRRAGLEDVWLQTAPHGRR